MPRLSPTENLIYATTIKMMETTPFEKIKIVDLVKKAGISRSAFYNNFSSVYEVVQSMEELILSSLPSLELAVNTYTKYKRDSDRTELMALMEYFRALCGPNGDSLFESKVKERSKKICEAELALRAPEWSPIEREMIAAYLAGGHWNTYKWLAFHTTEISMKDATKVFDSLSDMVDTLLKK